MRFGPWLLGFCSFLMPMTGMGSSTVPRSLDARLNGALGFFRGTVTALECYRDHDGSIWTCATVAVNETLKGRVPKRLSLHFRGGRLADEGEICGLSPTMEIGDEGLFLLSREPDGRLTTLDGAAGAWHLKRDRGGRLLPRSRQLLDKARARGRSATRTEVEMVIEDSVIYASGVTGLYTNSGAPSRFLAPDRGEPIECYVDMQTLPAGVNSSGALGALSNAFAAWAGTSSVQWTIAGITNFGIAGTSFTNGTRPALYVQMHDLYDVINSSGILGVGGRNFTTSPFPTGGLGGNVFGTEFFPTSRGYVVIEHTSATLENLANLAEVLCHEIGHALGMRHSSEDPDEPDPVLADAMMYYRLHAGNRGATLGDYDPPVLEQVHPRNNTPPWNYARVMDVVATSPQTNGPAFNEIEAGGYDLQDDLLSLVTTNATSNNGTFALVGARLRFIPSSTFDLYRIDPDQNAFWDRVYIRSSDGTNASPWSLVRVVSRSRDTLPAGTPDGMPDNWMTAYFGTADPGSNPSLAAGGDYDGDGLKNIDEFRGGFIPTDPGSRFAITGFSLSNLTWQVRPYDLYEIQRSTGLVDWSRHGVPRFPTGATENATITIQPSSAAEFFRVIRVP